MAYRNNIKIKTKFETIESCRENCIDKVGKVTYASSLGKSLVGQITPENSFIIGSDQKGVATHEFVGKIIQKDDGIYMEGVIAPRKLSAVFVYLNVVLGIIIGIILILGGNLVFMLFGILFMIVPWFNVRHLNKSHSLYDRIIKKVT